MSKIFYAESIPDSVDKIAWTEICHGQQGQEWYMISYRTTKKMKYELCKYTRGRLGISHYQVGNYKTLNSAISKAKKEIAEKYSEIQ